MESQAFDRTHRIGQLKEVQIGECCSRSRHSSMLTYFSADRLTISNTVEQRIGEMQERKQGLADAAFGEGGGASKLLLAPLRSYFC